MKCIVFFACLLVAVYGLSDEYQDKLMAKLAEIAEKCIPESGASDDDLSELMNRKVPTTKEGKCLVACFLKQLGMIKNGKLDKAGAMALLEPIKAEDAPLYEKFKEATDTCIAEMEKETEKNECELAVKFSTCCQKQSEKLGIDMDSVMG